MDVGLNNLLLEFADNTKVGNSIPRQDEPPGGPEKNSGTVPKNGNYF